MSMPAEAPVLASNFLIPDATFLAEIVAFLLILAVIWKYVVPPLQKSMTARQEAIKKSFDDEWAPLRARQDDADFVGEINPGFFTSGEQEEGAGAFLQKRVPDFAPWR
jgi:1,4-dihydroxy-2-naphthoyl-CoA synthase